MKLRIVNSNVTGADGIEFEVDDDATDEEIAEEAFRAVAERVDFGWEEVQ